MKESIGYTVSLNIMIVFITIIVAFLCAALIYFKSNKVSNIITSGIEKYEGYEENADGTDAIEEIAMNLTSIGYGSRSIKCDPCVNETLAYPARTSSCTGTGKCSLISAQNSQGEIGYCVYVCYEENVFDENIYKGEYYYYKIRTNMMLNVPILNDILDIPIYSNTNRLYNFDRNVNN